MARWKRIPVHLAFMPGSVAHPPGASLDIAAALENPLAF
jgi:hypothetical protein